MPSADIKCSFSTEALTERRCDVLLIPTHTTPSSKRKGATSKDKKPTLMANASLAQLDKHVGGRFKKLLKEEGFTGSKGRLLSIQVIDADNLPVRRVVLVGLGEPKKVSLSKFQHTIEKAMAQHKDLNNISTIAVAFPTTLNDLSSAQLIHSCVDAAHITTYQSEEVLKPSSHFSRLVLITEKLPSVTLRKALKDANEYAKARSLVKDLVNKPANQKQPETLVELAKKIGKHALIKTKVQSTASWIEKNMPCFYEVARGSVDSDPPRFITLTYTPPAKGRRKNMKKIALVGKSVMFDTGGYQVKPGNYMNTMKGDMTGGASVIAAMGAIAALQPNIEVTAYLAATPNKINSYAMIPDSIVNTTCGKKVEIRHTDAEGRLTLIDAVAKAAEENPDEMITIATLTGAAGVAVGCSIALMGNNTALRNKLETAARFLGEPVQSLDVTEDDYEAIASTLDGADIRNTQKGKGRGAQTAGAFVMSGAPDDMPMAHLDIAGADFTDDEKATGIAARTLVHYVMNQSG